jgi:hydrogenase/urease accessory protein HupE
LWFGCLWSCPAHNVDTSYTRVRLSGQSLDLEFLLDLQTLGALAELDADGDGRVTRAELDRRVPELREILRRQVLLRLDRQPADLGAAQPVIWTSPAAFVAAKEYHTTLVSFSFHKPLSAAPRSMTLVCNLFDVLGERHVNLATIDQGERHAGEFVFSASAREYTYLPDDASAGAPPVLKFLQLGIGHIFLGYDHILFLVALLLLSRFREMIRIVTAFTVAHTVTLTLAALQVVNPPARWIEAGIAATILYVALENLWVKSTRHRWVLTFLFGLIHGFGFANVLRELGLPTVGLVRSLFSFNLGVEIGQVAIVAALFPVTSWLARQPWRLSPRVVLSLLIFLFSLAWFIERAFAIDLLPSRSAPVARDAI